MAGRESRKYSSTLESSLYVVSVRKVVLDHPTSSFPMQSVWAIARPSSCDELPRPTDSRSRAAHRVYLTSRLKDAWPAEAS